MNRKAPQAASRKPQAASRKPQAASRKKYGRRLVFVKPLTGINNPFYPRLKNAPAGGLSIRDNSVLISLKKWRKL
jgi:hypothetical protein